jgi:GTP-binding nuclear protein Ran
MSHKIVIAGTHGTGKTTFVKRVLGMGFERRYIATLGVEVYPLETTFGSYTIWDTAGAEHFGGLREGYYLEAHTGIVFVDGTPQSEREALGYIADLRRMSPNVRVSVCFSKIDKGLGLSADFLNELNSMNVRVVYNSSRVETNQLQTLIGVLTDAE